MEKLFDTGDSISWVFIHINRIWDSRTEWSRRKLHFINMRSKIHEVTEKKTS